jgi:hypothetical protein
LPNKGHSYTFRGPPKIRIFKETFFDGKLNNFEGRILKELNQNCFFGKKFVRLPSQF